MEKKLIFFPLLLFWLLLSPGPGTPAPPYACLVMRTASVLLVRDKEVMISFEDSGTIDDI